MKEEEALLEGFNKMRIMKSAVLAFVTGNNDKFEEVKIILHSAGINVEQIRSKGIEVQSDSLKEIARQAAIESAGNLSRPVLAEDAGLFIESLNGFPGPYSSYVFRTLGCAGILQLMKSIEARAAEFKSAMAYCEPDSKCRVFEGTVRGVISDAPRSGRLFGFDPIFIPSEGDGRAFSQMEIEEKNTLSHRGKAVKEFVAWHLKRRETGK